MTCLNLATTLRTSAKKYPNKSALIIGNTDISYAKLDGMARIFSSVINTLLEKHNSSSKEETDEQTKIAIMIPNTPHFTTVYYGTLYNGSVVVPLNVLFKTDEVTYHINNSDSQILVVWEGFLTHGKAGFLNSKNCKHLIIVPQDPTNVEDFGSSANIHNFNILMKNSSTSPCTELKPTSPNDTAVILYTSGTTGKPKGAELSHFNMFQNAQHMCTRLIPLKTDDIFLCVLPLFHSFGQTCVQNSALMLGSTIILQPKFDPHTTLSLMSKHNVSFFAGVPTMYIGLLHYKESNQFTINTLRYCVSGGSSLPTEVMYQFDKKYNVNILEGYGLSETSPVASFNILDKPKVPGSIGVPIEFVEFRLVDKLGNVVTKSNTPGEIMIKGPNVMKGYYKDIDATNMVIDKDGWFATGDISTFDDNGYYKIIDRKKDMVIRGGYNVYSCEVEEVLYQHEAVAEAAVIGIPDKTYGEEVKAFVTLKPGFQDVANKSNNIENDIIDFCKSKLAAYKYPRIVEIYNNNNKSAVGGSGGGLPKGPTGKILKRELRHQSHVDAAEDTAQ